MSERPNEWARMTIAGFQAIGASRHSEAGRLWISAGAEVDPFLPDDPRRAVAQSNAGVAHALLSAPSEADAHLAAAERGWMRLVSLAENSDPALAAGSSAFQFRLASKNLGVFQSIQRKRLQHQCEAALAITRFNRLAVGSATAAQAMAPTLASLLSGLHGTRSPEVQLLRDGDTSAPKTQSADTPYADKATELNAQYGRLETWPTDIWQLLGPALALLALIRPSLGASAPGSSENASADRSARAATLTSSRR
ncbi:hypothetical protein [Hyphomicrobium sp. CS1GBMeth3]|uniref:hypothetical protein n=1 Tax=Hyphomicrobium sp. CS1GBMeth3 TaxID=1892845 RepID=UPI0009308476|nr:hypothetical protein [Hyphomicrobium sp. CS1GBMeth3]